MAFPAERRKSSGIPAKKSRRIALAIYFTSAKWRAALQLARSIDQLDKSKHSREAYEPRRCLQARGVMSRRGIKTDRSEEPCVA